MVDRGFRHVSRPTILGHGTQKKKVGEKLLCPIYTIKSKSVHLAINTVTDSAQNYLRH